MRLDLVIVFIVLLYVAIRQIGKTVNYWINIRLHIGYEGFGSTSGIVSDDPEVGCEIISGYLG